MDKSYKNRELDFILAVVSKLIIWWVTTFIWRYILWFINPVDETNFRWLLW